MTSLALKVALIALAIGIASACKCTRPNVTRSFCESGFTGIVHVNSGPANCGERNHCYDVTLTTTFKGAEGQTLKEITTHKDGATCGSRYSSGSDYLVMGNPTPEGSMRTQSCGYGLNWSSLTDDDKASKTEEFKAMKCPS